MIRPLTLYLVPCTIVHRHGPVPAEIRLVPPGRLLHLARYSGARRAWWINRSHPVPGLLLVGGDGSLGG